MPVGSLGSGRRLTGAISRAPPTVAFPSGLVEMRFFSWTAFSALGRLS